MSASGINPRMRIDGRARALIAADDRGLLYGDGLFETLRVRAGVCPLWDRHVARLRIGCRRLRLPPPATRALQRDRDALIAGAADAVLRITWTRGSGMRGYAPPQAATPRCVLALAPAPAIPVHWYARGIRVRFCEVRLARQPRLAGIKHLNRLEQVLARAEWRDAAIAEGLMLDTGGHVIGATAANVFAVIDGMLVTPRLDQAGVAGVGRAVLLDAFPKTRVRALRRTDLERASEVLLVSAVRGVLPVRRLDARRLPVGPWARRLQDVFAAYGIGPGAGA